MQKTQTVSVYTILGLLLAFVGGPLVLSIFKWETPPGPLTNSFVITRELSVFFVAGILLWIIIRGEKLGLNSIGLHGKHWGKSILWSLLGYVLCIAAALLCIGIFKWVGIQEGATLKGYENLSPWVMTLVMLRAGVVEELTYRGYIMERLEKISGKWVSYFLLPTVVFGLLHFSQGIRGMIIAFALGMVLSYLYYKKRDLKANMIAHFLVDFISNVLIPLFNA
jgi:membrane protease YdiL (CAAX protease family)